MKTAWIVVREEKHIDPKFWVCTEQADALKIATDVTNYWRQEYAAAINEGYECSEELHELQVFNFDVEDLFRVYVEPVDFREAGETAPTP